MKKADLMEMIGKHVEVTFFDGTRVRGILGYTERFSEEYDFRKPNMFTIREYDFKVSHIKHIEILGKEQKNEQTNT